MRLFRKPLCYLGGIFIGYVSFDVLVSFNPYLEIALGFEPFSGIIWIHFIDDFLQQSSLWAVFYLMEKIAILYITIHYHFRSDLGRISRSKEMQNALMALYEASLYLYPIGTPEFVNEDAIIGNATGSEHGEHRVRATRYLSRLGIDTYALTSFFGNFLSSDPSPHWLRPASAYATVERAMANSKSAAALARRIWMSMVPAGKDSLSASDIAEVLGPFRKEDAETYFKSLDQNELGDVRLDELEWTVAESGKVRNAIYRSMHNADHCINTLDWILLLLVGAVMMLFIMLKWIPSLKDVQETLKFFTVGFAFAIGRTVHHFTAGVIFALFDHPYDVGDRLELWTNQSPNFVSVIVERISLLYTVFRRADSWVEIQVGNEYLQQCRIENITRSGCNREAIGIVVDIRTSFQDLKHLRAELDNFLKHADNKRDFLPAFSLAIVGVHELDKMELKFRFAHRTNFSVEALKSARHMKLMCAILTACRKLRIQRPDAEPLGQPGRPLFSVHMTEKEANERMAKLNYEMAAARFDAGVSEVAPEAMIDVTSIQHGEDDGPTGDIAKAREALEMAAAKRQAQRKAREDQEKEAASVLAKLPVIPHKGPPVRTEGSAVSTGLDANVTGLRALPHFRG